jgi:hypothetical protein
MATKKKSGKAALPPSFLKNVKTKKGAAAKPKGNPFAKADPKKK